MTLFHHTEHGWKATAAARRTDPQTSKQAARKVEATGRAAAQRWAVLAEVRRKPGQTAAEIAAWCGLERHAPSRRCPELERAGYVRRGAARLCNVTGSASLTWWPVEGA